MAICTSSPTSSAGGTDAARLPDIDLRFGRSGGDEDATALCEVLAEEGARLRYVYDFGNHWEHRITLEKTLPRPVGVKRTVRCVGGRRANVPAEDIGGLWGLAEVLDCLDRSNGFGDGHYGELVAELRAARLRSGGLRPGRDHRAAGPVDARHGIR